MFEILTLSFTEFCRSIAAGVGNVLSSAFVVNGHITMYFKICLIGIVISFCAYIFNLILKRSDVH